MSSDRWTDVFAVFDAALAASGAERDALLARECGGSTRLREKVESLLAAHHEAEGFLSSDALPAEKARHSSAPGTGALTPGTRIGAFEVERFVGAGGMGEVYRARDTRLDRRVAIKVLPRDAAADPRGRARFMYEARAIAQLSHPHICALHDFSHQDGIDFLVMEYLNGESLASRLRAGAVPIPHALAIAIQIADGLVAAHAEGIVHRDLKPANIVLVNDRSSPDAPPDAKLLDFGLAVFHATPRLQEATTAGAGTGRSSRGAIAGTPQYMAPEQVRGKECDPRTDIFAFGSVLYEMLTGHPPFDGRTVDEIMTAVLHADTPGLASRRWRWWLPSSNAWPSLEKVIERCLEKDPGRRFGSMNDVKAELQKIARARGDGTARIGRLSRKHVVATAAGVMVLAGGVVGWIRLGSPVPASQPPAPMRVVQLTALNGLEIQPTFSPDGTQVAFSWNGEREDNYDIYLKTIGSSDVRRLTTDPAVDTFPIWSPDGQKIAFLRDHPAGGTVIHAVLPTGGEERKLSDFRIGGGVSARITWSPDGRAIVGRPDLVEDVARQGNWSLYLIPLDGRRPRRLTGANAPEMDVAPAFSPDGRSLAYAACAKLSRRVCDINVIDLNVDDTPAGAPRHLVNAGQMVTTVAWSRDGTSIVYDTNARGRWEIWRVSRDGSAEPERLELAGDHARQPAIMGDRVAFERQYELVSVFSVRGTDAPKPVLVSSALDYNPRFSPDGRRIAFSSRRSGDIEEIWLALADGSGARQLTRGPGSRQSLPAWSPDGQQIAFESRGDDGRSRIWVIPIDGGVPRRATTDADEENAPVWSRDGRRIYFLSDRGGRGLWGGHDAWQIPADGGAATRVTDGGSTPVMYESADGKELIYQRSITYQSGDARSFSYETFGDGPLWAVPLAGGTPRELLPCVKWLSFAVTEAGVYYSPCGERRDRNQTNGFLQTWAADAEIPIKMLEPSTGRTRIVGSVRTPFDSARLAVSPDGRTILVHRNITTSDLMVIEHFR